MKRILFSHSYFLRLDSKQWATAQPYPPLGTLYAAAVMREKGYDVSLFDAMFAHDPDELITAIEKHEPGIFIIYDDGFNYLTKMCLTNMREAAFKMTRIAKKKGCKVIVSGSDSTDHYQQYLEEGADFILIGEAEQTLAELMGVIEAEEKNFSAITGLAYKENDTFIRTPPRKLIKDLDSLPMPAWDLLDIEPYKKMWLKSSGYFSLNMGTTRGCPFKCNWCAKPIYGNRYNSRSPQHVITELKFLKEKYAFDHIWFCDDIFGLKPGWVHEFANLIEKEKLAFKFKIQARADLLLQENYIRDLARAGCDNIWMGAESGSQKILDAMDKGITVEQIYTATHLLKKNGIKPSLFIQFGYLDETKEDIGKTIQMINDILPHSIGISVSYPLPGTVFYEKVRSGMKEKTNWKDSDELMSMFANVYPPEFYKQLHRYIHAHFHHVKAKEQFKNLVAHPFEMHFSELGKILKTPYYMVREKMHKRKLDAVQL